MTPSLLIKLGFEAPRRPRFIVARIAPWTRRSRAAAVAGALALERSMAPHSAAAADVLQLRIHPHVFRADLIYVCCRVRFRSWSPRLCGCGRDSGGLVVACQSGSGFRYRFALARLSERGLGQRTNPGEYDEEFHFSSLLPGGTGHEMRALPNEIRLFSQIKYFARFSQPKCPQSRAVSIANSRPA
jgi:hypothetical protein